MKDKSPSGIMGLDRLMGGGLDNNSVTLVSGKIGTGKSIFCLQFLYNGAVKHGEKGLYITTDENKETLRKQAKGFGWDLDSLEKKGVLRIVQIEPFDIESLSNIVSQKLVTEKIDRLVIDSVSLLELYMHKEFDIRKALFQILEKLREKCKLNIITTEIPEDSAGLSRFGIVEFAVDSVIILQYESMAKRKRSLIIRKMRTSKHSEIIHPFSMMKNGISVSPK